MGILHLVMNQIEKMAYILGQETITKSEIVLLEFVTDALTQAGYGTHAEDLRKLLKKWNKFSLNQVHSLLNRLYNSLPLENKIGTLAFVTTKAIGYSRINKKSALAGGHSARFVFAHLVAEVVKLLDE